MTCVGMPTVRARARAGAPGSLLMTARISAGRRPSRTASTMACRLLPRPETRTTMPARSALISALLRFAAFAPPLFEDHDLVFARVGLDVADDGGGFAGGGQQLEGLLGVRRVEREHHAYAAIEGAIHFEVLDAAHLLQPVENDRTFPG